MLEVDRITISALMAFVSLMVGVACMVDSRFIPLATIVYILIFLLVWALWYNKLGDGIFET